MKKLFSFLLLAASFSAHASDLDVEQLAGIHVTINPVIIINAGSMFGPIADTDCQIFTKEVDNAYDRTTNPHLKFVIVSSTVTRLNYSTSILYLKVKEENKADGGPIESIRCNLIVGRNNEVSRAADLQDMVMQDKVILERTTPLVKVIN